MSRDRENQPMTAKEVDEMIAGQLAVSISKMEAKIKSLGCGSEVGSLALKRHEQYHADKINSEIENLKAFREGAEMEFKTTARKMSEASIMLADVVARMQLMFQTFKFVEDKVCKIEEKAETTRKETKKEIDKFDFRLYGIIATAFFMCVASVWSVIASNAAAARIHESVKKINSVDVANQGNTEAWMAVLASKLSGASVREIVGEYEKEKLKLSKEQKP